MKTYSIEAEYESGYVHRETDEDRSPYLRDANIFSDILNRRPDAIHGPLVRFSLNLPDDERLDVDFTNLPGNAEPIRLMYMEADFDMTDASLIERRLTRIDFGVKYTTADGEEVTDISEVY